VAYQVKILSLAEADLDSLDPGIRERILNRIVWLGENAEAVIHHRLVAMRDELQGLCRFRVGDYRIFYWVHPQTRILRVYRVQHRREAYREF
jgi:mRNA interferase RelE/StbE